MARTKRAVATKPPSGAANNKTKIKDIILKKINEQEENAIDVLDKKMDEELQLLNVDFAAYRTQFPMEILNRTIAEIKNGEVCETSVALSDLTNTFNSTRSVANTTKSIQKSRSNSNTNSTFISNSSQINKTKVLSRSRVQRSLSVGCEDEGYTTAESTRGTNSGGNRTTTRQSRSKMRTQKTKSSSRSLSRNMSKQADAYKTPANKLPLQTKAGTITPKCKPNTPLLYVRRPKVGEIAWSNQGSPLLVSSTVAPEKTANINIPVGGDVLSMLPTRGVRGSQIPDVDRNTKKQLEILRDNLIKVCESIRK